MPCGITESADRREGPSRSDDTSTAKQVLLFMRVSCSEGRLGSRAPIYRGAAARGRHLVGHLFMKVLCCGVCAPDEGMPETIGGAGTSASGSRRRLLPRHLIPDPDLPTLQHLRAGAGAPLGPEGLLEARPGFVHPLA